MLRDDLMIGKCNKKILAEKMLSLEEGDQLRLHVKGIDSTNCIINRINNEIIMQEIGFEFTRKTLKIDINTTTNQLVDKLITPFYIVLYNGRIELEWKG
jgi:hypothetical protein